MTTVPRLDATLCFVAGDVAAGARAGPPPPSKEEEDDEDEDEDEEENDEEDEEEGSPWSSGDVGGFECYIEAETKEGGDTAEAAEVYKGPGAEDDEDETSLLSVTPGANVLSLVMRDLEVMRFVKYVSSAAPGSRWDVAVEYELAAIEEDEEDEDEDES